MLRIKERRGNLQIRAFTLLESLLVLGITAFLTLLFSAHLIQTVHLVKGELLLLQFENIYKDTQEDAALLGQTEILKSKATKLVCEHQEIIIPKEVEITDFSVKFNEKGENSSLQKLKIFLPYEKKTVIYQLEMGSGKFKKKIS